MKIPAARPTSPARRASKLFTTTAHRTGAVATLCVAMKISAGTANQPDPANKRAVYHDRVKSRS
jgi:hypothetical protein